MLMFLKRSLIMIFVTGAFFYGRFTGVESARLDNLENVASVQREVDILTIKLRKSDEVLLAEQTKVIAVKKEEVIKYVTMYRDVIKKVPTYVECIDNSGLLDVINSTTPTRAGVDTSIGVVD
jgi:hypothetical protein